MKRTTNRLAPLFIIPALLFAGCADKHERASAGSAPAATGRPGQGVPVQRGDLAEHESADEDAPGRAKSKGMRAYRQPSATAMASAAAPPAGPFGYKAGPSHGYKPEGGTGRRAALDKQPTKKGLDSWGSGKTEEARPETDTLDGDGQPGPADMYFRHYGVNPTIETAEQAFSTFSIDVDNASYTMARAYLDRGQLPAESAVRVEEFINAFDYGYEAPHSDIFSIHAQAAPSPNRTGYHVLHIGLQGRVVPKELRKAANLVFVVDVSGSMNMDNRLGLVKKSLGLLLEELREDDTVAIVTYGSSARVLLSPTTAQRRPVIFNAINQLRTEGATNAAAGLKLGYQIAAQSFKRGGINRVVLCSDGVANVGMTGAGGILETVERQTKRGITISTVGFGMGNYNDVLMEQLAQGGNGNYYYVDKLAEARRVFVDNLAGTLQVLGKDVKIQMEFDKDYVARYRLLGYENRMLQKKDFTDDRVDAGEVGAGHSVTAIYEVKLKSGAEATGAKLGTLRIRYKAPEGNHSQLLEKTLPASIIKSSVAELASPAQLSLAVAGFAEKLRGSYWARNLSYDQILERFDQMAPSLRDRADVRELRSLIEKARSLDQRADKFASHTPLAMMDFDRVPVLR